MRPSRTDGVNEPLRDLWTLGAAGGWTDGQLVERFLTGDSEAADRAFAELVRRHGPMVLRVGRAYLGPSADADDAFQATFLVLIRRARSLVVRESLGPWLHQVAVRVARYARKEKLRREARDRLLAPLLADRADEPSPPCPESASLLHEELARLPDRLRVPLLLCDLQGLPLARAARQVGCPVGTIKSRLARGRTRLRERLARRGVAPAALLLRPLDLPAVPLPLVQATRETARLALLGGALSPALSRLASGASRMLFLAPSRSLPVVATLGVVLGVGAFALARQDNPPPASPPAEVAEAPLPAGPEIIAARGQIESAEPLHVTNKVEGVSTIVELLPEGTLLQEGQRVALLDSAPIREKQAAEQAAVASAEEAERSALAALGAAEFDLREYAEGLLPLDLAAAQERIRLAGRWLDRSQKQLDQARQATPPDPAAIDAADSRVAHAQFQDDQARRRLAVLEQFTAPRRTRTLTASVETARGALETSRRDLAAHRERADHLARQVEAFTVLSPAAGLLIYFDQPRADPEDRPAIRPGATVRNRQILFQIYKKGEPLLMNARVQEARVHMVKPGQSARVTVDAFPGLELTGKLVQVNPLPNPTSPSSPAKLYTTLIALDSPPPGLRPGMTATAEVTVGPDRR